MVCTYNFLPLFLAILPRFTRQAAIETQSDDIRFPYCNFLAKMLIYELDADLFLGKMENANTQYAQKMCQSPASGSFSGHSAPKFCAFGEKLSDAAL